MDTGMLHLHTTVVIVFLLSLAFKTVLLLANNTTLLDTVRAKTKVLEMILGTLILVTGGYLLFKGGHPATWLMVKVAIVLVMIPMAIVGLKKGNKALAVISLLGFVYVYGVAETRSLTFKKQDTAASPVAEIYTAQCVRCHGESGDAGQFGAKNLKESTLSREETAQIILNGKGAMPGFNGAISPEKANELADYIATLKK
ncbi:Cytochrome c, mono-and diheme variants [Flexibacter flexilis DSM 6793]|uniref:Cytochrome c, mono-and diheme variants n=2 Tax=Flexibacter flexilis TaxID=998 RepID=A0A1I1L8S6_9BACT|nr:Cytochrome c, mono-and diheme variants [Flexibacter flexilis DSM 6793]